MGGSGAVLTVWLFLALLSVGEGLICFEDDSRLMTVTEAERKACVNVTRSIGDPDEFEYQVVASRRTDRASEGPDFTTVPAGATATARFPLYEPVSFQNSSLTVEICATIILDDIACETQESIAFNLNNNGPSVCTDMGFSPQYIVLIEDSTRLPVRFNQSEVRVAEGAGTVDIVVELTGNINNLNSADLQLVEDPNESGCLEPGFSGSVQFGCNHPTQCGDLPGSNVPVDTVIANLAADDAIADCHRFCSVVLEEADTSQCLFTFPDGNRLSLVVLDDEDLFIGFSSIFIQVREDSGPLGLTLQSTQAANQPFTVHLNSRLLPAGDNSATIDDFTPGPYDVTFSAGQTSKLLNISITNDDLFEDDTNDFYVSIVNFTSNCSTRPDSRDEIQVQILDEDMVSVQFPSGPLEAPEDSGELVFSLTSDRRSEIAYEVKVSSVLATGSAAPATDGEDFNSTTDVVRFEPGSQTSTTFLVQLVVDPFPEKDETFSLQLAEPDDAEAQGGFYNRISFPRIPMTATILNDDPPHEVCFVQPEYRVAENVGGIDVSVRLNGTSARANITVRIAAKSTGNGPMDASVTPGDDLLDAEWDVTILAGQTEATFRIPVLPDDLAEADEMFRLELTVLEEPYFAVPCSPGNTITVVIENDDAVVIEFTAVENRTEGEHQVYEVTFSTRTPFVIPFQLTVNLVNGTATGGEDFGADPITLSFTANVTSVVANIPIINDAIVEDSETFQFFTEAGSSELTIDVSQAMGSRMILDNEAVHHFDSVMMTLTRNESDGSVPVTVRRRRYMQRETTVVVQPVIDTAPNAAGSEDFTIDPITVTFPPGEDTVTVSITLTQDMISELDERFLLRLVERTSVGGALVEDLVVEPDEATVIIRDPGDVVCVSFSQASYFVLENGGVAEIVVEADKDFSFTFQVEVNLMPETAQLNVDYLPESLNLTFMPGSRTAQGNISIVDDKISEMVFETALMMLIPSQGNARDVCVTTPGTATLRIMDDDNLTVAFEMPSYTVSEGSNISICILANIASDSPTVVMVTPQANIDFSLEPSVVTFDPGETRKCINFSAITDAFKEDAEDIDLSITLMEQANVSLGDAGQTTVTIIDTTGLSIQFERPYYPVMEGGTTTVNVVLSNPYDTAFLVIIMPERTGDITLIPPFFQFTPPRTSFTIRVRATPDNIAEVMENITLSIDLSNPDTQRYGVDLGEQATTVIGVENTNVVEVIFAPTMYSVMEGERVDVQLSSSLVAEQTYTIQVVQVDGFDDFEVLNGGIATFYPGNQSATVQISAHTDDIKETDEMFTIEAQLTDSSTLLGVVIGGGGQADVTVTDSTPAVMVVFDPTTYSVTEGGSVNITLTTDSGFSVPFNVTLSSDSDEDVQFLSTVATFQPSSRTVSVTLNAVPDDIQEPLEIVTLDFEITATIDVAKGSNSQATVNVSDNTPSILVSFQEEAYTVVEGDTVEIGLVANRLSSVAFEVTVRNDTSGDDYEFVSGPKVTFPPGTLTSSIQLRAHADSVKEPDEVYSFSLEVSDSGGVDVSLGEQSRTQVTIVDPTSISIEFQDETYLLIEGADVVVTLLTNGSSTMPIAVNVTTTPGSADETDYHPGPYQAQFAPGQTAATVRISSPLDACAERQENFTLNIQLSAEAQAMNIHLGTPAQATVQLRDPTVLYVSFNQSSYRTDEGTSFAAAVITSMCYEGDFDVAINTMDVSATAGEDYQPPSSPLQFRGERSLPLSISTLDDSIPEDMEEQFKAMLSISSVDSGLNVTANDSFVPFTITDDDEQPVTVSFDSSRYTTNEGDTLMVGFEVTGQAGMSFTGTVTVTASNGTAMSPLDFRFTTASVNPVTDKISIPILTDDIVEDAETFGLELTIPAGMNLRLGNITRATVTITDVNLITVNDTITADPVYAVPINVVEGKPPDLNLGELSICYEIHGDADKWFNFISDKCLSLNALYREGKVFNRTGHVIRQLAILSEDDTGMCKQVLVMMDDDGMCSVTVDGTEVNISNSGGLRVNKNRNRVRVSVPNCDNHLVVMWASCEDFYGTRMMRLVVSRGLNLRPTSHGFLGQFWNVDVALEKFNETHDELLKQMEGSYPHYIVHLRPPDPAQTRSFVGELYTTKWDNTHEPCIYVGSNQAGTGRSDLLPLGTVVEGAYSDYIMGGAFEYNYQFTRFESESCMQG